MPNFVLYRKYRPQSFSELTGQIHIVRALVNQLKSGTVAHAYLFSGPRGLGKTTIARIVAKALNCASPKNGEPCNACQSCMEVTEGRSFDVIEIDAASNRGIDEIRDLRERIKFAPSGGKNKIYIIDEVHMLTKEAFNALLKTLEEPPAHAVFILATTEVERVPATILSRVQRFDFRRLPLKDVIERLQKIAKAEGVTVEKDALELIALNAEGSLRDAESLLGKVMAVQDEKITRAEVESALGIINMNAVTEFVSHLAARKTSEAVNLVNRIYEEGYDLQEFTKTLVSYLRNALLLQLDSSMEEILAQEMSHEQADALRTHKQDFMGEELTRMIRAFLAAGYDMRRASLPQLPLELAIVELTQSEPAPKIQSA
ncbi:MAG: DNA polymerase III subunit gamma/tau [Parcubacteria group bacterium]|nr:DNA polymerase III subunit gamma/tau [Parcubacteria group bacterium]